MADKSWVKVAAIKDIPINGGACIKHNDEQIAIFNYMNGTAFYACQNLCPHKQQMALARGIIGDKDGEPKVACPFHKKSYSLKTGHNMNGEDFHIETYQVKVDDDCLYIMV